jgi:hypothetical protein
MNLANGWNNSFRQTNKVRTILFYQIIQKIGLYSSEIFIKDCDSFFDHDVQDGNYVCISKISQHEILKKISSKSFTVSNNQGIITDIVEKDSILIHFVSVVINFLQQLTL